MHPADKFDSCRSISTPITDGGNSEESKLQIETVFGCCDRFGGTDAYLGYDCKVDVLGI